MSRLGHLLRSSLEDAENIIEVDAETVVVQAEETPAEVETELLEAAKEVETTTDVVEELEKAAATLESIALGMEEILEADAEAVIEPQAAEFIAEHVEEVTETLGLTGEEGELVSSSEAFAADRRVASMESLQKVKDFLTRVWNAIKNAIINAYNAVVNFFKQLFQGADALEKRRVELKAAAGKIDAAAKVTGKIALRGAAQIASGKVVGATGLVRSLKETAAVGTAVFGAYIDQVKAHYAIAGSLVDEVAKKDNANTTGLTAKLFSSAHGASSALVGKTIIGDAKFDSANEVGRTDGGDATDLAKALKAGAPVLVKQDSQVAGKISNEVEALRVNEINSVLDAVKDVIGQLKSKKGSVEALDKAVVEFRKTADVAVAGSDNNKIQNYKNRLVLQAVLRAGGKPWSRPVTQYSAHAFGASRKVLTYVERSIAAHKVPAATA